MAAQTWRDRVQALEGQALATRLRANDVDRSTATALAIAADQLENSADFAARMGTPLTALETYLATKRSNVERFLREYHETSAEAGMALIPTPVEYEALVRDAGAATAARQAFDEYVRRQHTSARQLLSPLTADRAAAARLDPMARAGEAVAREADRLRRAFAATPRRALAFAAATGAAIIVVAFSWSAFARGADASTSARASAAPVVVAAAAPDVPAVVPAPSDPPPAAAAIPWSPMPVLEHTRIVALYGYPREPIMGALGKYSPHDAAREVTRLARTHERAGAPRPVGALELIVVVAKAEPTADGLYVARMPDEEIALYVEAAREHGLQLILDIQIGWSDPLVETKRFERVLLNPFVHIALDPEFATRHLGVAPGRLIGSVDATSVNAVEGYLGTLVREHRLPKKLLILHQFTGYMLRDTDGYLGDPAVERVIDMDGFGPPAAKLHYYNEYALASYAQYPAIKLFFEWDKPLLANADLDALAIPPALIIYH